MNKLIIAILSFLTGGVSGYILSKKVNEQDLEQRIQDEVESVKTSLRKELDSFKKEREEKQELVEKAVEAQQKYAGKEPEADKETSEPTRRAYRQETAKTEDQLHKMAEALKPKVISPDELGEAYGEANVINLTYYSDGILCGSNNKPLNDAEIKIMVGEDFATHFGEYEDDSVCIVNAGQRAEYEILAEDRSYKQFLSEHPELMP